MIEIVRQGYLKLKEQYRREKGREAHIMLGNANGLVWLKQRGTEKDVKKEHAKDEGKEAGNCQSPKELPCLPRMAGTNRSSPKCTPFPTIIQTPHFQS